MSRKGSWKGGKAWSHGYEETTVVLTGLPKTLNAEILLSLLDQEYLGCYDYFYLPMDMDKFENTGLAYINFREHSKAVECQRHFSGFSAWPGGHFSERSCRAQWSSIQGYEANIQKQQKLTDWVNSNIPEDCKPMVFDSYGTRLPTMEIFPSWQDFEDSSRVYYGWRNSETHEDHRGWWKDEWYGRNGRNSGGYDAWRNGNAGNATSDWSGSIYKDQWSDRDRSDWRKENYDTDRKWDRDHGDSQWNSSGVRWNGWNGRQDAWSNGHSESQMSQRQVLIKEASNSNGNGIWAYPDYDALQQVTDHITGVPEVDTGIADLSAEISAEVMEFLQNDPNDPKASNEIIEFYDVRNVQVPAEKGPLLESTTGTSASRSVPQVPPSVSQASMMASLVAAVAVTRYACPSCSASFAKWSACQNHIFNEAKCRKEVETLSSLGDLQQRCKEKVEELPPVDPLNGQSNSEIAQSERRFQ